MELRESLMDLDIVYEWKKGVLGDIKIWGLSNRKNIGVIYWFAGED